MNLLEIFNRHPVVSTDTRKLPEGCIFFALKGPNFNGNRYAEQALNSGASYAVVDEKEVVKGDRYLLVEDVLKTLQQLSTRYRQTLKAKFIVIAGSNGKTTSKELISAVLSSTYKTFSTQGNLNNHIGVPLTLLSIKPDTEFAVIEIGANHKEENLFLCEIAKPDYGVVTNCGKDHLEGFGGIQGVIDSNKEVYDYLKVNNGKAFINADDSQLNEIAAGVEMISYGKPPAKYAGEIDSKYPFITVKTEGHKIESSLFGSFQLYNIMLATAIGEYFKVPIENIQQAVKNYVPANNRSQLIKWNHNEVLLDAYNANPSSMGEMVKDFSELPLKNKVAILGDMFEMGEESDKEHAEMVELANKSNIEELVFVGHEFQKQSKKSRGIHFSTTEEAKEWILSQRFTESYFMVKGSRGMALEKIFKD